MQSRKSLKRSRKRSSRKLRVSHKQCNCGCKRTNCGCRDGLNKSKQTIFTKKSYSICKNGVCKSDSEQLEVHNDNHKSNALYMHGDKKKKFKSINALRKFMQKQKKLLTH